jgi:hypothetical protein
LVARPLEKRPLEKRPLEKRPLEKRVSGVAVGAPLSRPSEEDDCASLPLHAHSLFRLGVYLEEIWLLRSPRLAARPPPLAFPVDRPSLRLLGAVGSPSNAIATF